MSKTPEKSQENLSFLSSILKGSEKEKVTLPPETDRFIREHLRAAQEKLARGEKLTTDDLAFMDEARRMVGFERLRQIELPAQYADRLRTLATFGFIEDPRNPAIEGIDGKTYPAPTMAQIAARITPEKAELIERHIKDPILLVVPFAMPLKAIAGRAGARKGKLDQNPVNIGNYDIDSDLPDRGKGKEQLVYFPEKYDKSAHEPSRPQYAYGTPPDIFR